MVLNLGLLTRFIFEIFIFSVTSSVSARHTFDLEFKETHIRCYVLFFMHKPFRNVGGIYQEIKKSAKLIFGIWYMHNQLLISRISKSSKTTDISK